MKNFLSLGVMLFACTSMSAAPTTAPYAESSIELVQQQSPYQKADGTFVLQERYSAALVAGPELAYHTADHPATLYASPAPVDQLTQTVVATTESTMPEMSTEPTVLKAGCCDQGYGNMRYWIALLAVVGFPVLMWTTTRKRKTV